MGRSIGEVIGSVIGSVVGSVVVVGLKQPCVFGYSLGSGLLRWRVLILDSILVALVEPPVLLVFSSLSSTTRGSPEVYRKKSRVLVENVLGGKP
jgi:hypothetical protein